MSVASTPLGGFGPDGEELCGEIGGAGGVEVQVAAGERAGEAPGLVGEALRGVGVGIDDEGLRGSLHFRYVCGRRCARSVSREGSPGSVDLLMVQAPDLRLKRELRPLDNLVEERPNPTS